MKEIIVLLILHCCTFAAASKLVLYDKNGEARFTIKGDQCASGAILQGYHEISCACASGLWGLYKENCEKAHVLLGGTNMQCFPIDYPVRKVNLLSVEGLNLSSATVFDSEMTSMWGKYISSTKRSNRQHFVPAGFPVIITTGNQTWRLPHKKMCLKPNLQLKELEYCMFKLDSEEEYRMDDGECLNDDTKLAPLVCQNYDESEELESKSCAHRRVRRKIPEKQMRRPKDRRLAQAKQKGRVFLGTVEGFKDENSPSAPALDENATRADENNGLNITIDTPLMNSELWNFMTVKAQERLGLREKTRAGKGEGTYSPAFAFLEIAKQIQQKACPNHYVTDEHYDVAVGAFISILKNHYKYVDSFLDFATSERIEDSLRACLANITEYPFMERTGKIDPKMECNDSAQTVHGSYFMFDQILELSIGQDQASRNNEPIIETVWKVFVHAHSACYAFFENNLNDHHRFATIMLNLFTSEINDMWFNVTEVTPEIYSGFLGEAVDLMDSVAYCSIFSRLESKYPWDLPRPKKGNVGAGGGAAAPPPASRRKRDVDEFEDNEIRDYQCLQESDARNFCPVSSIGLSWGDYDTDFLSKYV